VASIEVSSEREPEIADAHRLIAACFDALADVPALLGAEPGMLTARTLRGETALHWLVVERQLEAVRVLAACGAELNTVSGGAISPLGEAAERGDETMVAWLLAHGARPDLPGECGPTLLWAVDGGKPAIVSMMLVAGAVIDGANRHGQTALHAAAKSDDSIQILRLLLDAGATGPGLYRGTQSPLDVARANGAIAAVALLEAPARARRT